MTGSPLASVPVGRATMASALHDAANYHAWTASWTTPYLAEAGRLLDIGSGTANHLLHLGDRDLVSVDIDARVTEELRERFASTRPHWRFETADLTRSEDVARLGPRSFETVFSSNVFEHIPDDTAVFRAAHALLRPGGRIVLLLPAHQGLFGSVDALAGHHRRYDRDLVRSRFAETGFTEERIRYVNALGAVGWFVNNRLLRHRNIESRGIGVQIRLFDRVLVPLLRIVEGDRGMPFGQSILAVGRKPA